MGRRMIPEMASNDERRATAGDPGPPADASTPGHHELRTTRRRWLAGLGGLAVARTVRPAAAAVPERALLFRIDRSTNANYVRYDAVMNGPTTLDPKKPVMAYWVLAAKDGKTEPLSSIEQRAYGFRVKPEGNDRWLLVLRAASDRSLRVLRWGDRWVAQAVIAGRSAVLERLYVSVDEGGILPKVNWVDLFGRDMSNQEPVRERIHP